MIKISTITLFLMLLVSCSSPSVEKIAGGWCECKKIEMHQSSLQGEQCFQKWESTYGDIELNDAQIKKFNDILNDCMEE